MHETLGKYSVFWEVLSAMIDLGSLHSISGECSLLKSYSSAQNKRLSKKVKTIICLPQKPRFARTNISVHMSCSVN